MAAAEAGGYDIPACSEWTERSGKFRHIFAEPIKKVLYEDLKSPMTSGEGNYMAANRKFLAYAGTGGGGPIYIIRQDQPGRGLRDLPGISTHRGKVWDWDFHPFYNNIIASGSDDCKAHLVQFPIDGVTEAISDPTQSFEGHSKKVTHVKFSEVTNVLATASFDGNVKLWNIEDASCVANFSNGGKGQIHSLDLYKDSSLVAAASKDKKIYTFDPRSPDVVSSFDSFTGAKSSKLTFLPRYGWLLSTGFDKSAKRQIKIWDLRDLSKAVYSQNLDSAASILVPRWDDDLGVLYTMGKGEGTISYYEIINDSTKVYYLSNYRNTQAQRGGAWVPKAACDVWKCEVQRFYKLAKNTIIPLSFTVPRKAGADVFQSDIYPDCFAHKQALSVDEYLGGAKKDPVTMEMDPATRPADEDGGSLSVTAKKTYAQLETELTELKKKYAALEARLAEVDASYAPESGADEAKEADAGDYAGDAAAEE